MDQLLQLLPSNCVAVLLLLLFTCLNSCRLIPCLMSSILWNILYWNMRGMNSDAKCLALRNKIDESNCSIVCLQETKKEFFKHSFIRKCCPQRFDKFEFMPSEGASGGLIIIW